MNKQRALNYIQVDLTELGFVSAEGENANLWRQVIIQAMLDATSTGKRRSDLLNRDTARAWFFAPYGVTLDDFEDVCDMAGLSSDKVRDTVKKMIENNIKLVQRGN